MTALDQLKAGTGFALLNFWAGRGGGKRTLLEAFATHLGQRTDVRVSGPWDAQVYNKAQLAIEMRQALDSDPERIKIFLIDNLSAVTENGSPDPDFPGFEHSTLAPLVLRDDVLIIIASQHEIRQWRELEVKMRHDSIQIPSLTLEEVSAAVADQQIDPPLAYQATCGHRLALNWLLTEPGLNAGQIALRLEEHLLGHLPEDIRQIAQAASLLLHFNQNTLHKALSAIQPDRPLQAADDLRRIQHLYREGILVYDQRRSLYRFADPAVRQLLRRAVCAAGKLDCPMIHRALTEYYKEEARRPFFLPRYIVNVLYHLASTGGGNEPTALTQACLDWIERTRPLWVSADWGAVLQAWQDAEGDPWAAAELQRMIGAEGIQKITSVLAQYAEVTQ
jgi:hypothetical protein